MLAVNDRMYIEFCPTSFEWFGLRSSPIYWASQAASVVSQEGQVRRVYRDLNGVKGLEGRSRDAKEKDFQYNGDCADLRISWLTDPRIYPGSSGRVASFVEEWVSARMPILIEVDLC